jgi:hypothetical protein
VTSFGIAFLVMFLVGVVVEGWPASRPKAADPITNP